MSDIPNPTLAQLDLAIANIALVDGLDMSFIANCRPDVSMAEALWDSTEYRVLDETAWPPEYQEYLSTLDTPDPFVFNFEKDDFPRHLNGRVYHLPASDAWLLVEHKDYHYITEHIGLTPEQITMYVMPMATDKYSTIPPDELKLEIAAHSLNTHLYETTGEFISVWADDGILSFHPVHAGKLPSTWEGYIVASQSSGIDDILEDMFA